MRYYIHTIGHANDISTTKQCYYLRTISHLVRRGGPIKQSLVKIIFILSVTECALEVKYNALWDII